MRVDRAALTLELLPRVRAEGDERALAILLVISDPDCDPSSGACCFAGHPALATAVRELGDKVRAKR